MRTLLVHGARAPIKDNFAAKLSQRRPRVPLTTLDRSSKAWARHKIASPSMVLNTLHGAKQPNIQS